MQATKSRVQGKYFFAALLVVSYAMRAITDAVYVSNSLSSIWISAKYVPLILAVVFGLV